MSALGSTTDMARSNCDVCFTSEGGHSLEQSQCLLCAKSGQARYLCELAKSPVMKRAETIMKEAIVQMGARLKPNCPPTIMR